MDNALLMLVSMLTGIVIGCLYSREIARANKQRAEGLCYKCPDYKDLYGACQYRRDLRLGKTCVKGCKDVYPE